MAIRRFRLYVDETGTEDLNDLEDPAGRFLGLVGIILDTNVVRTATAALDDLKRRHFDPDPDEPPLVFHRSDVVKGRRAFQPLQEPNRLAAFGRDWLTFLAGTDFCTVAILVDKLKMTRLDRSSRASPYDYAMERLIERFVHYLDRLDAVGDVMPERRHGKKDAALQSAYEKVRYFGTEGLPAEVIVRRLPSSYLKFRAKAENITGLQIADSLAHPSAKIIRAAADPGIVLSDFEQAIATLLYESKFDRAPFDRDRIWSYGIEEIP